MLESNVTTKGQVTIPASLRKQFGIQPGGKVRFAKAGRKLMLERVKEEPISSLFGILKAPRGRSLPDGADIRELAAQAVAEKFVRVNREWAREHKKPRK